MKKIFLSIAFAAIVVCFTSSLSLVSCQEKTKEKLEDAKDAIGTEVEQKIDTVTTKVETAIDSVQSKTGKVFEKGAEKIDIAAEKLKEAAKR
jgi:hypothetical protein